MPTYSFTSARPPDSQKIGPPARKPFPPPRMDVTGISRKWLDLAYGNESPSQKLDIYLPEQGDGPFPVIVALHGGAFAGGDKSEMQITPMMSGLQQGYAVVPINYRLSGEAQFPSPVQDSKSAIRYLRMNAEKFHLDSNRIAVWGASAGAYYAAMVGTSPTIHELDDPKTLESGVSCGVQAVVIWSGPVENFIKMDEEFRQSGLGIPNHSEIDSPESRLMGMTITEIPELVRKASPMSYITRDVPRFLIQHGELDHVVPAQQSINFAAALERIAGPDKCILEIGPGVYHHGDPAFETEENIQHVLGFLDESLLQSP